MKDGTTLSRSERQRVERSVLQDPFQQTLSHFKDANTRRSDTYSTEDTSFDSGIQDANSGLITKASLDFPLRWEGGLIKVEKNVKTSITCGIPQTASNGRWSATVHGSSIVRGPIGCASGSMNVAYHITRSSQIHGGLQVGDKFNVSLGGILGSNDKATSAGVNLVSSAKSPMVATLSAKHKLDPCMIISRVTLGSSSLRPIHWNVSVSSLSIHKIQLGMGWSRSQPLLSMDLGPKLSAHRRGNVCLRWRPTGGWNVGLSLTEALTSKVSSLGVGIRLSKKRLEWVFTWNRGDVLVRVPIILSQYTDAWMNCLQVAYISLVSTVIQDVVADLWNLNVSPEEREKLRREQQGMKRAKARSDAELQKQLMKRQAQSKSKAEHAKQGLVIRQAVYQAPSGDSWDVTTQLQFWTDNSSLELPASSKRNLLGFYDVANGTESNESDSTRWTNLWKRPTSEGEPQKPTLTVQYYFANRPYEITILDEEPLVLPSSKAVPQ